MTSARYFDLSDWARGHEIEAALREQGAVHRTVVADFMQVWVIGRYAEARAALKDRRLSKDAAGLARIMQRQRREAGQTAVLSQMFSRHMLFSDGAAHDRLRGLVAAEFTRSRMEGLRPRVEHVTTSLLDVLAAADGPVDLVEGLAFPLPLTVICQMLGVPEADWAPFRGWTRALMEDHPDRTVPASQAMEAYFDDLIRAKRAAPGDDLLSALVVARDTEDRLSDGELMATCFLLFVAGHETTTNLISNAARCLLENSAQWRRLTANPTLVPMAVEEVLRYDSPVSRATHRYTAEAVTYGGVTIPAGEIVLVSLSSANRDDRRFEAADELRLDRDTTGHIAFGHGIHHCLGAALGRIEAQTALGQLTQRFPHARLAVPASDLKRTRSAIMNGHEALPVALHGR